MILRQCSCGATATTIEELVNFKKDKAAKYGRRNTCNKCVNKRNNIWLKEHPEVGRRNISIWEKKNPGKAAAKAAKRNAAKLQRTPSWANLNKIEEFYIKAREMSKGSIKYEVDHIIPLQGKTISGFHIETNLQIISKSDNCSKGNKYS